MGIHTNFPISSQRFFLFGHVILWCCHFGYGSSHYSCHFLWITCRCQSLRSCFWWKCLERRYRYRFNQVCLNSYWKLKCFINYSFPFCTELFKVMPKSIILIMAVSRWWLFSRLLASFYSFLLRHLFWDLHLELQLLL